MRMLLPITVASVHKPVWQLIFARLLTGVPGGSLPHELKVLGALEDLPPLNPLRPLFAITLRITQISKL